MATPEPKMVKVAKFYTLTERGVRMLELVNECMSYDEALAVVTALS